MTGPDKQQPEVTEPTDLGTPNADEYEQLRLVAEFQEVVELSDRLHIQRHDVVDPLEPNEPTAEFLDAREEVERVVAVTTEQALQVFGFDETGELPSRKQIVERVIAEEKAGGGSLTEIAIPVVSDTPMKRAWHEVKHTALGLWNVYGDPQDRLPVRDPESPIGLKMISVPEDDDARNYWDHHYDPREVRRRGEFAKDQLIQHFEDYPEGSHVRIAGIACGAAQPDIYGAMQLAQERPDLNIELDLIDFDIAALSLAGEFASLQGFSAVSSNGNGSENGFAQLVDPTGRITINLIEEDITNGDALKQRAGQRGYDIVEAIGTYEYFKEDDRFPSAKQLLADMHGMLANGGAALYANMTTFHNIVQILGVVKWSQIRARSLKEDVELIDSGLPGAIEQDAVTMSLIGQKGKPSSYAFVKVDKHEPLAA